MEENHFTKFYESSKAPKGKYRVVDIDTFDPPDSSGDYSVIDEFEYLEEAIAKAVDVASNPFALVRVFNEDNVCMAELHISMPSEQGPHIFTNKNLQAAEKFAKEVHTGQFRKDGITPYSKHLDLVVTNIRELQVVNEDILLAGWLHDTLEDRPEKASLKLIASEFGEKAANIVASVTKDGSLKEEEKERLYLAQLQGAPWEAKVVKFCDVKANIADLKNLPKDMEAEKAEQIAEKKRYLEVIKNDLVAHRSEIPMLDWGVSRLNQILSEYGATPFKL